MTASPYFEGHGVQLHHGDCLDVLATLPDCSVDSVVTDPPYGLEFMGKEWDTFGRDTGPGYAETPRFVDRGGANPLDRTAGPNHFRAGRPFQRWCEQWATECLRVLKPGGHMLAFGGSRTYHRLTTGIEDAGFEIRDCITWHSGSGFPKSRDVSKAIDARAKVNDETKRRVALVAEVIRTHREAKGMERAEVSLAVVGTPSGACWNWEHQQLPSVEMWPAIKRTLDIPDEFDGLIEGDRAQFIAAERAVIGTRTDVATRIYDMGDGPRLPDQIDVTAPATPDAQRWQGWGTALKPATEFIVVARKPLTGTVAQTVLEWGTGALNIDACRVEGEPRTTHANGNRSADSIYGTPLTERYTYDGPTGRWPANVVFDEHQAAVLDEMSGDTRTQVTRTDPARNADGGMFGLTAGGDRNNPGAGEVGGASRFYYVAKADANERPTYHRLACECEGPQPETIPATQHPDAKCSVCGAGTTRVAHPTVKPLSLMRQLARLVTPPGGTVLEPFPGSGTTVEACILEGFHCVAIEKGGEYVPLIRARVNRRRDPVQAIRDTGTDLGLFATLEDTP